MSYTKIVKQWERESKRKDKQQATERKRQQARTEQFQEAIYIAKGKQEKQEKAEQEERQQRINNIKQEIFLSLQKNNPFNYQQFLIIYDILSYNFNQIISDLYKNKITIADIKAVIEYIEEHSKELINEYWKDKLQAI